MKHLRDTILVFSSTAINFFLAYVLHFILGRVLGPSNYGLYGVVMNLSWVIGVPLSVMGVAMVKYSSFFHAKNDYSSLSGLLRVLSKSSLIINLLFLLFFVLLSNQLSLMLGGNLSLLIVLLAVSFPFSGLSGLLTNFFQGIGKVKLYSVLVVLSNIVRLIVASILAVEFGVNGSLIAVTISSIIMLIIIVPLIIKYFKPKPVLINTRELLSFSLSVLLTTLFINWIIQFDLFFVKSIIGSEQAGYYEAAVTLSRAFLMSSSVMAVFFPAFNKAIVNGSKLKHELLWAIIYTSLICLVGLLAYYLFGDIIINITYSSSFLPALPVLKILAIGYSAYSLFNVLLNFAWAKGEKKVLVIIGLSLFIIDLILLYFLTPIYGLIGAAWSTTITMLLLLVASLFMIKGFVNS